MLCCTAALAQEIETAASPSPAPVMPDDPYVIDINEKMQLVTVYTFDAEGKYTVPVKYMICSTSKYDNLHYGYYKTTGRYEGFHALFKGHYGLYATRFAPNFLFHSVPYLDQSHSAIDKDAWAKLGKQDSLGCIRLQVKDAKWIYDNCPKGTVLRFRKGKKTEELAEIKESLRPPELTSGWDPTDPDPDNPDYIAEPDATPVPTPYPGVTPRPLKVRIRKKGHA